MSTIRIGIADMDNTHPGAFVPSLQRTDGLRVTTVYDHGDTKPAGFAEQFAADNGIDKVSGSLEELVAAVDVGMVHSQNCHRHLERARLSWRQARQKATRAVDLLTLTRGTWRGWNG